MPYIFNGKTYHIEEGLYAELVHYLLRKNNRYMTNDELIEKTGVAEELIFKWLKSGKLSQSLYPNLSAPCERCGHLTNQGRLCRNCSSNLIDTIKQQEKDRRWFDKINKRSNTKGSYHYK